MSIAPNQHKLFDLCIKPTQIKSHIEMKGENKLGVYFLFKKRGKRVINKTV